MSWEIDVGEGLSVLVKLGALGLLWQCIRALRSVRESQLSTDLTELVDCLGKLKTMTAEKQSAKATIQRLEP